MTHERAIKHSLRDFAGNCVRCVFVVACVSVLVSCGPEAWAQGDRRAPVSIVQTLWNWTPFLLSAFKWNVIVCFLAMSIGTPLGFLLGLSLVVLRGPMRVPSYMITQFLRNSPWLVILFFCMYLIPFEFRAFGYVVRLPDWMKATVGFALPITAYVAEIVRGGLQSIPAAQWASAEALAFTRPQILAHVIVPQCFKRMLPPWMNLFAFVFISTVLINIVGVADVLTAVREALDAEGRTELLLPMYGYVLIWFFLICYPLSKVTAGLERRWAVVD